MATTPSRMLLVAIVLAMTPAALPGKAHAQDMMSTCAPEISNFCSDVSRGRGRITACLISRTDQLSAACSADVRATAQKGSGNILVPSGVRKMLTSGGSASVPAVCDSDVGRLCSGVTGGGERVLACLYAYSDKVTSACSSAVRSALN